MHVRDLIRFGVLFLALAASEARAVDCQSCAPEIETLRQQLILKEKTTQLLGANKAYLAGLSARQASKFLKVESNILMTLKKLDTIKKDTEKAQDEIVKKGCDGCQASEPSANPV